MTTNIKLQSTFKSNDTEEWIDIHFTRPIGLMWANFFNRFNVHPNVVTLLSIILGVTAGVMFYFTDLLHTVIGILLLMWANFYDSADGQLARMTGKKTLWGRILDGFAGDAWFFSIYVAICLRLTPQWGVWIWLLAAFSGCICHTRQCQLADYYRNIHLYFLKGEGGSELDCYRKVQAEYAAMRWRTDFAHKLFLFFYRSYTRAQEQMTPRFQQFKARVDALYGQAIPQELRHTFRAGSLPLMKFTNILTFNTRAIVLYLSLLAGYPWFYFVFEVTVMNGLFFYMRARHERLCQTLYNRLSESSR